MPWKGRLAKDNEIPKMPKIIGNKPVMHNGQKPVSKPPIVAREVAVVSVLQFFLCLYKI